MKSAWSLCRKNGFTDPSYYRWRSKFGGMDVSDAKLIQGLNSDQTCHAECAPNPFGAKVLPMSPE